MKHTRVYEIAWQGLKEGAHEYVYHLDNSFFKQFADGQTFDFNTIDADVTVHFEKHHNFFQLKFDIDGKVSLPCDRCADELELKLWDEFPLLIKLVDDDVQRNEDAEDDVVLLQRSETVIDLSKWLYEYLLLSMPIQRVHADGEDGTSSCNPKAIELLDQLSDIEKNQAKPIWKGLENIKIDKK